MRIAEEEEFEGWDPLTHYNFPSQQFSFSTGPLHITVLRLACPIQQTSIHRAEVTSEFAGFMRFYKHERKSDKHLLVNLQDRTSWEEFARCKAVEETSARAEFYETFHVLGLPKDSPFYLQEDDYAQMSGAPVFMESFKEQILGGIECGFFLPEQIKKKDMEKFIDDAFKTIHELFFEKKNSLSRMERLHFIEIFYALYITKILDLMQIDSISFTCKDALDTGAAQTALYYGLMLMLSLKKPWSKEDIDHLLWMVYGPALLVRDRAIHQTRWKRSLLALETIHRACLNNHSAVARGINALFSKVQFPAKLIS